MENINKGNKKIIEKKEWKKPVISILSIHMTNEAGNKDDDDFGIGS